MVLSEREQTTSYATKTIKAYLAKGDHISALLLTSIYLNIRLKSLLTEKLSPPENKWKTTSALLHIDFKRLVDLCNLLGLLKGYSSEKLKTLWDMRNKVAHESELWRDLSEKEQDEIVNLCESAIEFLKKTNS